MLTFWEIEPNKFVGKYHWQVPPKLMDLKKKKKTPLEVEELLEAELTDHADSAVISISMFFPKMFLEAL